MSEGHRLSFYRTRSTQSPHKLNLHAQDDLGAKSSTAVEYIVIFSSRPVRWYGCRVEHARETTKVRSGCMTESRHDMGASSYAISPDLAPFKIILKGFEILQG